MKREIGLSNFNYHISRNLLRENPEKKGRKVTLKERREKEVIWVEKGEGFRDWGREF